MNINVIKKEENLSRIGTMLNNIRVAEGITQEELAAKTKMGQSQISQIESDKKIPTLTTTIRYLKACGYEILFKKREES